MAMLNLDTLTFLCFAASLPESSEILNFLKAEGIPHYVLNKDGVIVEKKAPGLDSGAIIERIDHLLEL